MSDPNTNFPHSSNTSYVIPVANLTVSIKAKNGTDAPVLIVARDKNLEFKAVRSGSDGSLKWTATGNIAIEGDDTAELVKIKGNAASSSQGDSKLKVEYTKDTKTVSETIDLTVIAIEIKAENGTDAAPRFIGVSKEKKYKVVVTPAVAVDAFKWSCSGKISINGSDTADTAAARGDSNSNSVEDSLLGIECKFGTNPVKAEIKLTVVKVEIKAENGTDAPLRNIVKGGDVLKYKCVVTPVIDPTVYTITYKWEKSAAKVTIANDTAQIADITGSSTSAAVDDETLTVKYTVNSVEIPAEIKITVIEIGITPATMHITESLDSTDFEIAVLPAGVAVADYEWLHSSADGSWPAAAGNNPALNYSYTLVGGKRKKAKVTGTRWFAPTNNRRITIDRQTCTYKIYCKATVGGHQFKAPVPADLKVEVANYTGSCSWAVYKNWATITIAVAGGVWSVTGQGGFSRSAPVVTVNTLATSQFFPKADGHENKHVHQWTAENPWQNLFDANALYNNTIRHLTSNISASDLRTQISNAVVAQYNIDRVTAQNTMCTREKGAFDHMNTIAPHFLEFDDADWKPLYGCP